MPSHLMVLIIAGGTGERFWPRSRTALPKQFLRLCGAGTLLQETFRRASRMVPPKRIFVVTPSRYRDVTLGQIPDLPEPNLILEPVGRDTAAAIGFGATVMARHDPRATMIVLPADHVIANEDRFLSVLRVAGEVADAGQHLVTVGITPTRPETGYGYIQCGDLIAKLEGETVRAVRRFTEKPALDLAVQFLSSGEYLWNSGMFAWRVSTFLDLVAVHLPYLHEGLQRIAPALGTALQDDVVYREFLSFPKISIDYGLMERAGEVVVVPGDFGWDDVGSWAAVERVREADEGGNVLEGRVVAVDTQRCLVLNDHGEGVSGESPERLIVTYGVDGLLIVDTPDVLLVADKTQSANLKHLVGEVRRRGYGRYLDEHRVPCALSSPASVDGATLPVSAGEEDVAPLRIIPKPWGQEIWWAETDHYVGKFIEVKAGQRLSLQYHQVKLETMLFTRGTGTLILGDRIIPIREGLCVTVPPGTIHRVAANTDVAFYEVSTPEVRDVVRLADEYGRADPDVVSSSGRDSAQGAS